LSTSVIPAMREVEMKGSQLEASLDRKLVRPCVTNKLGMLVPTPAISILGGRGRIAAHGCP
jgi:hypothetical protein